MKNVFFLSITVVVFSLFFAVNLPSTELPLPSPPFQGKIGLTNNDSTPSFPPIVKAPKEAPNILLVLTDDVGFGASSTFGGPISTPTLDTLAREGIRFNQFHTTSLCSPTRAALLTGRNHHSAHFGCVADAICGYPGYDTMIGKDTATVAEVLRQNGYATSWFGKNHNLAPWLATSSGPFDSWPTGLGFDYFYGFNFGMTNQYVPTLYENTTPIEPHLGKKDYTLNDDLAERAVAWLHQQKTVAPDKPVLIYFAPGGTHSPHHVPDVWTEPYKGKFDAGWDVLRRENFERQKRLGVIPSETKLTPMHPSIPRWETLDKDKRRLYARYMEVYAGFLAHTDAAVGRVVQAFKDAGEYDNTLVIYIQGDNGASAEGRADGVLNEVASLLNGVEIEEKVDDALLAKIGGPEYLQNYPVGWALALCSPFQWAKGMASHYGGTRNGMVVSWPKRFSKQKGCLRTQWHHVVDIAPTLLESAGVEMPEKVDGVAQKPLAGTSMLYAVDAPDEPSRRTTQYFEMLGNMAIYHDGWVAATAVRQPVWLTPAMKTESPATYTWELYHVAEDFSQSVDLAGEKTEKLRELQSLFWSEAGKNGVLPIDERFYDRTDGAEPPTVYPAGRKEFVYRNGFSRLPESGAPVLRNRSFRIEATVEVGKEKPAEGMLFTLGGQFGGLALLMERGKPVFIYNYLNCKHTEIGGKDVLESGKHRITLDFAYDGKGRGKGGNLTLLVDDHTVASGRVEETIVQVMSLGETLDVGLDSGTPIIADRYDMPFRFTGTLEKVRVTLGD